MWNLSPEEYEALTGITKAEYEARVLAGARAWVAEAYPEGSTDATVEAVEINGDSLDASLVVLFRIPARPEGRFGCRTPLWPASTTEDDDTPEQTGEWLVLFGIVESVEQGGLVVRECVPDGVTWVP